MSYATVKCLCVPSDGCVVPYPLSIVTPKDYFKSMNYTIIGACVERGYILVGLESQEPRQLVNLPEPFLNQFVFDSELLSGDILIIKTDTDGDFVDIDIGIVV